MRVISALVILLAGSAVAFAQPTTEEIRKEYDAGKYSSAIGMTSRALAARGADAEKYDRYELLYLRGESLLKLKQSKFAEMAFEEAFAATNDRDKQARAMAMVAVIKRSPGLTYSSKNTPGTRIDIVDDTSRKAAMSAIYEDLRTALAPRVADATKATTLPPLQALLPDLFELTSLETVLTGDNKNSKQYFTVLGVRARQLLNAELRQKRQFLEEANGVMYGLTYSSTGNLRPRTLGTEDRRQLEDLQDYIARLRSSALRGRKIAQSLGGDVPAWEAIVANAQELMDRIQIILVQGQ
jgi:hypothetical protein